MFVQDHHSLEELQRLTKALRLETRAIIRTGTKLLIDASRGPVSIRSAGGAPSVDRGFRSRVPTTHLLVQASQLLRLVNSYEL